MKGPYFQHKLDRTSRQGWRGIAGTLIFGLVAIGAVPIGGAAAQQAASSGTGTLAHSGPVPSRVPASFGGVRTSQAMRTIWAWVAASHDNRGLPFIIVDKVNATVFVFDGRGGIRGAAPALLGIGLGDDSTPGLGQRKLATIPPAERTTPAGRFEAALGHDFDQDILWVDYDTALSLHRVIVGSPADRRHARLASASSLDNRISYGCINVPARFYDTVVAPAFNGTVGIVYILPETRAIETVFAIGETHSIPAAIP